MIIFSFDCALKNFGVCCIDVNINWKDEILTIKNEIFSISKSSSEDKLEMIKQKLLQVKTILDNVFKIIFINKVDVSVIDKCIGVKTLLKDLEKIAKPDIVLIENQWAVNDKAKAVAHFIEMFYADTDSNSVIYSIPFNNETHIPEKKTIIKTVQPSLKNCFDMDKSYKKEGFKKMSSYRANKKHSVVNFNYYCDLFKCEVKIKKKDDIADAFMMFYGYYNCLMDV